VAPKKNESNDLKIALYTFFGLLGAAAITSITALFIHFSPIRGEARRESTQTEIVKETNGEEDYDSMVEEIHRTHIVKDIVLEQIELIYITKNKTEKQNIINSIFSLLEAELEKSHNDDEIDILFAITRSINDEMYGDLFAMENNLRYAIINYRRAIAELNGIQPRQGSSYITNEERIMESLSRLEKKMESIALELDFFSEYTLESQKLFNEEYTRLIELIAKSWYDAGVYKKATFWYYWAYKQKTSGTRKDKNYASLILASEEWEFFEESNFLDCIETGNAGFILKDNVQTNERPSSTSKKSMKGFLIFQEGQVLERDGFKEKVGDVNAHWFKVKFSDGTIGYIQGYYLIFFPIQDQ